MSATVCRGCGRRDGTHDVDCRAVREEARRALQAACDHRAEYGATRTTGIPLGPTCCGRCGIELPYRSLRAQLHVTTAPAAPTDWAISDVKVGNELSIAFRPPRVAFRPERVFIADPGRPQRGGQAAAAEARREYCRHLGTERDARHHRAEAMRDRADRAAGRTQRSGWIVNDIQIGNAQIGNAQPPNPPNPGGEIDMYVSYKTSPVAMETVATEAAIVGVGSAGEPTR